MLFRSWSEEKKTPRLKFKIWLKTFAYPLSWFAWLFTVDIRRSVAINGFHCPQESQGAQKHRQRRDFRDDHFEIFHCITRLVSFRSCFCFIRGASNWREIGLSYHLRSVLLANKTETTVESEVTHISGYIGVIYLGIFIVCFCFFFLLAVAPGVDYRFNFEDFELRHSTTDFTFVSAISNRRSNLMDKYLKRSELFNDVINEVCDKVVFHLISESFINVCFRHLIFSGAKTASECDEAWHCFSWETYSFSVFVPHISGAYKRYIQN